DLPVALAKRSVEIGTARDGVTLVKRLVAEGGVNLHDHRRWRGGKKMRDQLLEQIVGELGKLVLELELHARREERRALQQSAHHRVEPILQDAAKPLCNAGILFGELASLLVKQLQFPIIQIEKFAVHA